MRSSPSLSSVLLGVSVLFGRLALADDGTAAPIGSDFVCRHPSYQPLLVSASPLVVYLENFLTAEERAHLVAVSQGRFSHSAVSSRSSGASRHVARTSQSAYVPRDAVLQCIEDRAAAFQGLDVARAQLEPLQLVKYAPGEQYHFHTDWVSRPADQAVHATAASGGNRLSSFFAYVHVAMNDTTTTSGGGTNFPLLDAPANERWCARGLVDCDEPWESGVTFRPVAGNAIFWRNMHDEDAEGGGGSGDYRTLHAGLPLTTGEKIGLNIWTRQGVMSEEARGPEYYPDV